VSISAGRPSGRRHIRTLGLTPFRGHRLSGLGGRGDELVFKRYWADLAERAVPSPAVVDRLDP